MTAEVHARLNGDAPEVEVEGPPRDHLTLLAEYADIIAQQEGSRPSAVLERAKSRAARAGRAD